MSMTPPPPDAREWDRQEAGRRAARGDCANGAKDHRADSAHRRRANGANDAGTTRGTGPRDDAPMDDYRLVAHAIASAPRSRPPADFAVAVAAKARAAMPDPGYERRLAGGLLLLLGAAALAAAVVAVGPAWQALRLGLGPAGAAWMAVPGACIALGWALGEARQLRAIAPRVAAR